MIKKTITLLILVAALLAAGCNSKDKTDYSDSISNEVSNAIENGTALDKNGFCGTSTEYACTTDDDCITGGCSGHVCQGKSETPMITTCIYYDCYNASKYDVKCGCDQGFCKWVGEEETATPTKADSCVDSGGIIEKRSFCKSVTDGFMNQCLGLIGASGCSLENSHDLDACKCPEGKCFDGEKCVNG